MDYMRDQKAVLMAKRIFFNTTRQAAAFRRLSDAGYITNLTFNKGWKGTCYWKFRMSELIFNYNGKRINVDFRSYQVKVIYAKWFAPKVYVIEPVLPKTTKHLYKNGSLCLYKPTNWRWQNNMQFDEDLFPTICTWLYHYEVWRDTGNWLGEEAEHDPSPELLHNLLKFIHYDRSRHVPLSH